MKAIICEKYGGPEVLRLAELPVPEPKDHEVLVRIHAATVMAGDCELRRFDFPLWFWLPLRLYMGVMKPRRPVLGMELSGEIVALGKSVTRFHKGDQIFATPGLALGAYAEYTCLPETGAIALKPSGMSYEEAATVPVGGLNALHFLRKADIQKGQHMLINGAAGCIGSYALQIAKSFGAEVTAVDRTDKLMMLEDLGADHRIDYTKDDFTLQAGRYDVVLEISGKASFSGSARVVKPGGKLILANPKFSQLLRGPMVGGRKQVIASFAADTAEDLAFLGKMIDEGSLRSVIDRCYPLEQMADAHRYVETGDKTGHVAITLP